MFSFLYLAQSIVAISASSSRADSESTPEEEAELTSKPWANFY